MHSPAQVDQKHVCGWVMANDPCEHPHGDVRLGRRAQDALGGIVENVISGMHLVHAVEVVRRQVGGGCGANPDDRAVQPPLAQPAREADSDVTLPVDPWLAPDRHF